MRGLPFIGIQRTQRITTDAFYGYRNFEKIRDGEFNHTENLSSAAFPMLSPRKKRGTVRRLTAPGGMIEKDALAYVDNGTLYYNSLATGLTGLTSGEKQLVSMGAYLCIWPDKKYFNTADFTDYGSMEADFSSTGIVSYTMCRSDGSTYGNVVYGSDEPEAGSCEVWVDTSGATHIALEWSSSSGWIEIPTVYTKVTFTSLGTIPAMFKENDGVTIEGAAVDDVNGSKILYAVGGSATQNDFIVVVNMIESDYTQSSGHVRIRRRIPPLDYVCECQNRLWGCFYGNDGEKNVNEIYCCALGDFRNWRQYIGLSTDSWAASVGSDGVWTGAVNYLGHPTFFKENAIHMVTVSAAGAHQIDETVCRGVQKGSSKSLQVVNETLYYKSRIDICAWQGGFPETASTALGDEKYYDAVAGTFGKKYYISMKNAANVWSLFVYDIERGIWIREDNLHALCFARVDDELYCIDASRYLLALNGTAGTLESSIAWQAVSGVQYYEYPDRKYLSRYNIKLHLDSGARFLVFLEYDSDGRWELAGEIRSQGMETVTMPVRPRRCDHMRMKLEGTGDFKLFSITRILEVGSDK